MSKDVSIPNHCSFCDKTRDQATKLIVSGVIAICDECVVLCNRLLMNQHNSDVKRDRRTVKHTNPVKIKNHLDQHVIGQDLAKMVGASREMVSRVPANASRNPIAGWYPTNARAVEDCSRP